MRGEQPIAARGSLPVARRGDILIDCGLRPEECFRLRWENVRDGALHVPFGKTENARRTIPLTPRRRPSSKCGAQPQDRVGFPSQTRSGHIEKSTLKKQHPKACKFGRCHTVRAVHVPAHMPNALGRITWTRTRWRTSPATAISRRRSATFIPRRKRCVRRWSARERTEWAQILGTVPEKTDESATINRSNSMKL